MADDQVAPLADGCPFGNATEVDFARLLPGLAQGFGARLVNAGGKRLQGGDQGGLQIAIRSSLAGVDGAVGAAGAAMGTQNHLGVVQKVRVDLKSLAVLAGGDGLGGVQPGHRVASLALVPALEEQHVDHHVGSRILAHGALRQADGADQIRHFGDQAAGGVVGLVHRPATDDEGSEAAGAQRADGFGNEIVVQRECHRRFLLRKALSSIRERRVPDGEVIIAG